MIINLFTLIFGLSSSYLFVYYIDRSGQRITPSIIFKTVSIYLSLLILIGYILDSFKLHVYILYYLMIFIIILSLLLVSNIRRKKMTRSEINSRLDIVCFFGLVFLGFIILIIPFIGVWFPLSRGVDAANHFSYIEHIFRNQMISQENFNYTRYDIVTNFIAYPFGAHLVTALFSSIFNLQPIRLVYPFMALITALTTGAIYIVSCESKTSKVGAFAGGLLTITTSYFFITLIENGSWSQVVGNFLVMAFTIFSIDYLRESTLIKLLPLILINMAIVLTYSFYIPIPLILLIFIFIYKKGMSERIRHLSIFLVSYILLTPFLVRLVYKNFVFFLQGGVPGDVLQNFGPIFLIFFIYGIIITMISAKKFINNLIALGLLIAIMVQTSLIGLGMFFGFKDYWFYKMFLLMVFPLGIFVAIGTDSFIYRFHKLLNNENEKISNIKSYFLIISLMLLTIIGVFVQISYIHYYNISEKSVITQDEYDVLMWIDNNIPMNDKVVYITDDIWGTFWRMGISHRNPDMLKPSDFIRNIQYDQFIGYLTTRAKDGTIIYIQNTTKANNSKDIIFLENTDNHNLDLIGSLKELYHKHDTAIYRFISYQLTNGSIIFLDDNWYPLEYWESGTTSWISNNATIMYYSPRNRNSTLSFNIISFYKPRTLQVYVNDEFRFQRIVSWQYISMKIQINQGKNTIRFYTMDECLRPIDIPQLNSQDTRCLRLAFQNITIT